MRQPLARCAAAILAATGGAVAVAEPVDAGSVFAREALRICVDTAADPAAIRALAAREGWTAVDPLSLPAKNRVRVQTRKNGPEQVFERTAAWTATKDGVVLSIGLFDVPQLPTAGRQCELMAWDIDPKPIEDSLRSDARLKDQSFRGLPLKTYALQGSPLTVTYVHSPAAGKVLHAFTVR